MTYSDKYPDCISCPVSKYCGTVVSSIKLCHSYNDSIMERDIHALTLSRAVPDEEAEYAEEQVTMWDNITD